jgi:hypothetical protein
MKTSRLPAAYDIEIRDSYNAHLARQRLKRQLAWLFVILAVAVLAVAFGVLAASADDPVFATIGGFLILCGLLGLRHLLTDRHETY